VKPEFWTDEALSECSLTARLLFIATWNFADDNGSLDRSAKQLKGQAFPHDKLDIEPLIQELLGSGSLIEYEAGGKKYLHIKNFLKHQVINRPSGAKVPVYDDSLKSHGIVPDDSLSTQGLLPSGREGKGRERRGRDIERAARASNGHATRRCPSDWRPDANLTASMHAECPQVDIDRELAKFRDHTFHTSRSDWPATFRNWIREAVNRAPKGSLASDRQTWVPPPDATK
jgi:hypothetical protein